MASLAAERHRDQHAEEEGVVLHAAARPEPAFADVGGDGHQYTGGEDHCDRPDEDAERDGEPADQLQYAEAVAHGAGCAAEEELEHAVRHEDRAGGDADQHVSVRLERSIEPCRERNDARHQSKLTISTQFEPLPVGYFPISFNPPDASMA